eukprot:9600561-Alexandrium_andersonii.AAC.1
MATRGMPRVAGVMVPLMDRGMPGSPPRSSTITQGAGRSSGVLLPQRPLAGKTSPSSGIAFPTH